MYFKVKLLILHYKSAYSKCVMKQSGNTTLKYT